jgi:hypothetical protein
MIMQAICDAFFIFAKNFVTVCGCVEAGIIETPPTSPPSIPLSPMPTPMPTTPAPTPVPTTPAPTPAPSSATNFPPCSVCGDGNQVTIPETEISVPPDENNPESVVTTCGQFETNGRFGFVSPDLCASAPEVYGTDCGCQPTTASTPPTFAPTALPQSPSPTSGNEGDVEIDVSFMIAIQNGMNDADAFPTAGELEQAMITMAPSIVRRLRRRLLRGEDGRRFLEWTLVPKVTNTFETSKLIFTKSQMFVGR